LGKSCEEGKNGGHVKGKGGICGRRGNRRDIRKNGRLKDKYICKRGKNKVCRVT
jgi:hypothetical protein